MVGFVYTRIRKVHTKEKWIITKLPHSTQLRFSFFVIHLFKLQVFSLSEDLAEILTFMLERYLSDKIMRDMKENSIIHNTKSMEELMSKLSVNSDEEEQIANASKQNLHKRVWRKSMKRYDEEKRKDEMERKKGNYDYKWDMNSEERLHCRIMSVLIEKFKEFAGQPRIARFDDISYNLRHHFMDKIRINVENGKNIYRISLSKIQKIFINIEEVYLHNYYKLDDGLLDSIIDFLNNIFNGKTNKNRIKQIKFLYYDYLGNIKDNKDIYFPSKNLNPQKVKNLQKLGWEIIEKHQLKRNTSLVYGVSIRLKPKKHNKDSLTKPVVHGY